MTGKERIDAYFDNTLSSTERESLLQEIEADPNLKSEFDFQQNLINGIKEYRKQELITRLNNVKVASVGQSTLVKVLGTIGVAAIMTGGIYWVMYSDKQDQDLIQTTTEKVVISNEEPKTAVEEIALPKDSSVEDKTSEEDKAPQQVTQAKKTVVNEAASEVTPANIPEMVEPDADSSSSIEANHDAPEAMSSEAISISSRADVEVKLSKKYNFHYQVIKSDLTLYGDFDDSRFEVIELKTNKGLNLYLFYKDFYYELLEDSEEIRPLRAVTSEKLILELNKRR